MATNTQADASAFVFPEDSDTASGSPDDPNSAGNFTTWVHGTGFTDHVESGMTFSVDYSVPEVTISAGKANFGISSVDARSDDGGSLKTRDEGNTFVGESTSTTLSLTDNDTNEIFVFIELSSDDTLKFQARTDGSTPSANSAFKIGEIDTSANSKDEESGNGRVWTSRNALDMDGNDIHNASKIGVGPTLGSNIDGITDIEDGPNFFGAKNSAPSDSTFDSGSDWGQVSFYLDETGDKIKVKALESDGSTTIDEAIGASASNVVLDIDDDGTNESTSLSEIATTNDTNNVFTEDSADKLLADVGKNWPSADDAKQIIRADNSGAVTHTNMAVTSSPSAGTEQSFELDIDSTSFLKLYTEADGSGGIQNSRLELDQNISMDNGTTEITSTEFNLLDGMTAKTGNDSNFATGTAGTTDNLAKWNADGDIVEATAKVDDLTASGGDTFTGNMKFDDDVQAQFGADPDYWHLYNSTAEEYRFRSTDIDAGGTDGTIWKVADGSQVLEIMDDAQFSGLSGDPTFSGHDHSETPLSAVPNGGLVNSQVTVSPGDGMANGGSVSLGSSTTLDVRLDIDDSGSDVTTAYGLDFGSNLSVTDNGDNTVTLESTASGGNPVALDLGNDGTDESEDILRINVQNDSNGIISENVTDEILIDMGVNWPTADSAASLTLGDNETVAWGADDDYEMEYVAGLNRWEFRSKDIDGGGTTGDLLRVDDGTQNIDVIGGLTFDTGGNTNTDFDEDGIDRSSGSAETFNIQNSGAGSLNIQEDGTNVVTEDRTLTGGNAIDAIGDLSTDRTVDVSTDGIQTDELDLSIAPTWTGTHDWSGGGMIIPTATDPTPTTEGRMLWDTDDDILHIGTGGGTKEITGGSNVTSTIIQDRDISADSEVKVPLHDTDGDYSEIRIYLSDFSPQAADSFVATVFDSSGDSFNTGSNYDIADQTNLSQFEFTEPSGEAQHNVGDLSEDAFNGAIIYKNPGANQSTHNFEFSGVWNDGTNDQSIDASGTFDTGSSLELKAMRIQRSGSGDFSGNVKVVAIE